MAVKIQQSNALGSINLTPMIDMVFLLLIFFLVASRFEEEERSIDVKLPQASEAMPLTAKPRELVLNLDAQGQLYVNGNLMAPAALDSLLAQLAANNPASQTVVIRADKRCPWQPMVSAMNACLRAGLHNYRVATEAE